MSSTELFQGLSVTAFFTGVGMAIIAGLCTLAGHACTGMELILATSTSLCAATLLPRRQSPSRHTALRSS